MTRRSNGCNCEVLFCPFLIRKERGGPISKFLQNPQPFVPFGPTCQSHILPFPSLRASLLTSPLRSTPPTSSTRAPIFAMGKLPPSLRSAKVPLSLLKPPPSPSPSSAAASSARHLLTDKSKSKSKPRPLNPNPKAKPVANFFSVPCLSTAISTSTSLLSRPSPPSPGSLLQSYFITGATAADAIAFFKHLCAATSFTPDKSTFHALLYHCISSSSRDVTPVLRVFNLMAEFNCPPDAASLDLSIRALCSNPNSPPRLDDACSLVLKSPVKPDEYTYNFLIRRLARDRPVSSVNHFIEQVKGDLEIQPNVVTYTILIDAWCRHGNLREATRLVKLLSNNGFKPDAYVYNTIMKGHCMLDDCGGVMDVYNKMKDEGVEPDLVTYNTLLFGLSKAGMMPQAKRILKHMSDSGYFPDVITYTSLMNGMCRRGEAMEARALLTEMENKGCAPNEHTYNTLVMGLCKAQHLDEALELFRVMVDNGMKMDAPTYASLVRVLCRADRIADAYEVFDYVIESKSLTEVSAYIVLESSIKWVQKRKP